MASLKDYIVAAGYDDDGHVVIYTTLTDLDEAVRLIEESG